MMTFADALALVRLLISTGLRLDDALVNPAVPREFVSQIRMALGMEGNIILEPPSVLVSGRANEDWLFQANRSEWYYWPTLRSYLLTTKQWPINVVRSLDEVTNRILTQMSDPRNGNPFDIRGLVIGYVQSGKTANYTALIAKAADVGYRLVIVLAGIDNGLRLQTQIRLDKELLGYPDNQTASVPLPPNGKQWHQFTAETIDGDFQPGYANYGTLQGTEPVLLVIKKNGAVLRRLHHWIDDAPDEVRNTLPVLMIDDEADQASIDTRGTYIAEDETPPEDYEEPTVINGLIRDLLRKFKKRAYVAYTATPFANILIPHDAFVPGYENDLYPKDFIIDLPKPDGYFGAEELFGRYDPIKQEQLSGMDVIRFISDTELGDLRQHDAIPPSLDTAIVDFVLAGAARAQRGQGSLPSTMLLHGSHLILKQEDIAEKVGQRFAELRDEWRYQPSLGIKERLHNRWDQDFRNVTESLHPELVCSFDTILPYIGPFFESIQVKVVNSRSGDNLDFQGEENLKCIVIGGNRLSRGLTIEGLTTSYFFRSTTMYDTLMQMGRWFGFRKGYDDLTRIFMPRDLARGFSDLAYAEHELREDIKVYEAQKITPSEIGPRILKHPSMLVTSRLKQRFANSIVVSQSYSGQVLQTFKFPFQNPDILKPLLDRNIDVTRKLVSELGIPEWSEKGPIWSEITVSRIIDYLSVFQMDPFAYNISLPLVIDYINHQLEFNELINWNVAIVGRGKSDPLLGELDLGLNRPIQMIKRTRLFGDRDSLGVITSPGDELIGLSSELKELAENFRQNSEGRIGINPASRLFRPATNGLLLIYPISKMSGHESEIKDSRLPIFEDPRSSMANDIIGIALSFPKTEHDQGIQAEYLVGTVGWRPL